MFVEFFYDLRDAGVPVNPTAFLRLQKALYMGLVDSLEDFYVVARSVMVKSERYFDLYDRLFARYFHGVENQSEFDKEMEATIRALLDSDITVRRFFEGETTTIPQFYLDRIKNDLGDLWQYLPEGALEHDPQAYLKRHEAEREVVQIG